MLETRIQHQFFESADLKYQCADQLARPIAEAAQAVVGCLTAGAKVLACGNDGAAGLARHAASLFVDRFERERPGLAALALSPEAAHLGGLGEDPTLIYAKQVQALGQPGDILLALSVSGSAPTVLAAVQAAHDKEMTVIAFTGKTGGKLKDMLAETDVHIAVPHERPARVHEVHLLALYCLCDAVDTQLLGEEDHS
ncbi:MAG: phosphoheptose isomerase [Caldimonas sp.]|nr:MAG: phosphoheptose isomerase [Caldimonas sp.]